MGCSLVRQAKGCAIRLGLCERRRIYHGRTSGSVKVHSWITVLGQQGTEAETGRLGVLRLTCPSSDHFEVGHHHHVFVLEVVAVEDVLAAVAGEAGRDAHVIPRAHKDGVLPTDVPRSGSTAVARDHLEVDEMEVD